ncbi:FMN-binding negative transcriptional regulator [Staphylococcus muscae]|uniref:Protease synthase and sporulation protein PAI 2 n=1 Tax=Staphylococcus muscae TaxID=1294 RepID=A0A240C1B7_9STAP|nr:FMN-binding negative transcriptional regulator [Staphylococcus muscae]AVQ34455.1 FMN-binding negative transcriptional regulator [Staphylococcus muscae]PNZ03013.1 FMN-binding negative transcriptional regulator [Staphylococcus muscae]GGA92928.1 protease synthase and sporulation protein PAI 2 [Staphylococcus muscae]SNW00898.1 transcriptional regulator [Staphylococcus muscae]
MYIPKYYQMHDYAEVKRFMKTYPFVTMVTVNEGQPIASHIPVMLEEREEALFLVGHLAKGNAQIQTLNNNNQVLVIFHGPHDYVSSSWYETEDVPTWDYQSVHIYGSSRIQSHDELIQALEKLLDDYEGHRENGATWERLSEQTKKQIHGIEGFEVKVTEIEAAYKLSQTRSENDKNHIVEQLRKIGNDNAITLAQEIKKYGL